jgi:hypothetical protein
MGQSRTLPSPCFPKPSPPGATISRFSCSFVAFVVQMLVLAACATAPTLPTCQPSQLLTSQPGFPEIQGDMHSSGELWALIFFDKAYTGMDEKIVWRITGAGTQFEAQARAEDGTVIRPSWGPDFHGGSSWDRPGEEWGTGFNFPKPGCWTITVTCGATTGEIRLQVLPSS